jgi:branched-chain amino acid transport system ATP-binding protein
LIPAYCVAPGGRLLEVFRIIRNLKGQNVTMLLVEQFAVAALKVAAHGYVLENGRTAVSGQAEKLRDDPAVKAGYLGGCSHLCAVRL